MSKWEQFGADKGKKIPTDKVTEKSGVSVDARESVVSGVKKIKGTVETVIKGPAFEKMSDGKQAALEEADDALGGILEQVAPGSTLDKSSSASPAAPGLGGSRNDDDDDTD